MGYSQSMLKRKFIDVNTYILEKKVGLMSTT